MELTKCFFLERMCRSDLLNMFLNVRKESVKEKEE